MDDSVLVEYVEPPILSHEPVRVLDNLMLITPDHVESCERITENICFLRTYSRAFVFDDKNFYQRGE